MSIQSESSILRARSDSIFYPVLQPDVFDLVRCRWHFGIGRAERYGLWGFEPLFGQ